MPKDEIWAAPGTEEGLDRAFAKLDEIKPHITVWRTSGARSEQFLSDGEEFCSTTCKGRISKPKESGVPAEIMWNGGPLHTSHVGIPKGAARYWEALDWIRVRTMRRDLEARYVAKLPCPNFAPDLFDGMSEEQAKGMPIYPANADVRFVADEASWAAHLDEIQERFDERLLR